MLDKRTWKNLPNNIFLLLYNVGASDDDFFSFFFRFQIFVGCIFCIIYQQFEKRKKETGSRADREAIPFQCVLIFFILFLLFFLQNVQVDWAERARLYFCCCIVLFPLKIKTGTGPSHLKEFIGRRYGPTQQCNWTRSPAVRQVDNERLFHFS